MSFLWFIYGLSMYVWWAFFGLPSERAIIYIAFATMGIAFDISRQRKG